VGPSLGTRPLICSRGSEDFEGEPIFTDLVFEIDLLLSVTADSLCWADSRAEAVFVTLLEETVDTVFEVDPLLTATADPVFIIDTLFTSRREAVFKADPLFDTDPPLTDPDLSEFLGA